MRTFWIPAGAFSAACAVALGAFGAHGLRGTLSPEMLAVFETAVRYQMYHAFGMLIVGLAGRGQFPCQPRSLNAAGSAFLAGTLLFSGSLYALSLTGIRWLGAITPLGGIAFMAGWILLGLACILGSRGTTHVDIS